MVAEEGKLAQSHHVLLTEFQNLTIVKERTSVKESYLKKQLWTAMREKRQLEEKIQQLSHEVASFDLS